MKKTLQINIAGVLFTIEEDAYQKLDSYLESLKRYFSTYESRDEIIQDIEARIAEKFYSKQQDSGIIGLEDVDKIISSMGSVADFEAIKDDEDLQQPRPQTFTAASTGLYKDGKRKALGGVLAGLAHKYEFDVVWARVGFTTVILLVLFAGVNFFTFGISFLLSPLIVAYFAGWVFLPVRFDLEESPAVRKLYRNPDDKVIGGVASGLASYLKTDAKTIRIMFVVSGLVLIGVIFYILLWALVPMAHRVTQKLQLEGQPVTIQNIERSVKSKTDEPFVRQEGTLSKIFLFPFRLIGLLFSFLGKLGRPLAIVFRVFFGLFLLFLGITAAFSALLALAVFFGVSTSPEWFESNGNVINYLVGDFPPLLAIFAFFTAFIPSLALILGGIALILNKRIGTRNVWIVLGAIWFASLLGGTIMGVQYGLNFSHRNYVYNSQSHAVPAETIVLDAEPKIDHNFDFRPSIYLSGADGNELVVNKKTSALGVNVNQAKENASDVTYNVIVSGQKVKFDNILTLGEGAAFRDQRVEVTLEIPKGKLVKFTEDFVENFRYWINGIDNLTVSQEELHKYTFKVNSNSRLECIDCPAYNPYSEINSDFGPAEFNDEFDNWDNLPYQQVLDSTSQFNSLYVANNFTVLLLKGKKQSVKVFTSGQESIFGEIDLKNTNGKLKVNFKDPFKDYSDKMYVLVTTPNIREVKIEKGSKLKTYGFEDNATFDISGGSQAAIDIQNQRVYLSVDDKSYVLLQGRINNLDAKVSQKSLLKASNANINYASLKVQSASVAEMPKLGNRSFISDKESIIKEEK